MRCTVSQFVLIKYSTCFGQTYCPSSGVSTLYTQQQVFVMLKFQHDKYLLLCIQCWDSWWWTADLSETCRELYHNEFEK